MAGGGAVIAAVLARRVEAGIVLSSTLRALQPQRRAQLVVVSISGLRPALVLVTAAIGRSATPARRKAAARWMRAAQTAGHFRAAGLEAPYREP